MVRIKVDSPEKVERWLAQPAPAIFQGQDLRWRSAEMVQRPLAGCAFLGCAMAPDLAQAVATANCLLLPAMAGLSFGPFRASLYAPDELYAGYDPAQPDSLAGTLDQRIYQSVYDPATRREVPVDWVEVIMRRLHDASISDALDDYLVGRERERVIAIMGGHDRGRDEAVYRQIAELALTLAEDGHLMVTGGGPGLMEAANLGAYCAGFTSPPCPAQRPATAGGGAPLHRRWLVLTGVSLPPADGHTRCTACQRIVGDSDLVLWP